jgi:hypothetical protein
MLKGTMSEMPDDEMKPEYDFSGAEPGKHYAGADAVFHIPVYLEPDVQNFLMEKAASKGVELEKLVNELLRHDIDAFHTLG